MQATDIKATQDHCIFCLDVLTAALNKQALPEFPPHLPQFEVPIFVTFHIDEEDLRGCIGTFQPAPIAKQLQKFTISSAFQDSRFPPISSKELNRLDVGVSMLVNFQQNKKWDQWEVGTNGIIIDFEVNGRGMRNVLFYNIKNIILEYGATFLPEVAEEQKWDKKTTLQHLISKAGYRKNYEDVLDKINLTTYETSKTKLTYKDYLQQKK